MTNDNNYLTALMRYLSDRDVDTQRQQLYDAVDGQFYVDFPESEISTHLNATEYPHQTLVGITIANDRSYGRLGAASHKLQETSVIIQIDVASLYGNSASYCREVCTKIKDLVFADVDYTLDSINYHIYVTDVETTVIYDDEMKFYHGIISITANYLRTAS